jgi:hypothetical protein
MVSPPGGSHQWAGAAEKSFHFRDPVDPPLMAATVKRGLDPDGDNAEGLFLRYHPRPQRKHIGIVVLSGKHRALFVPAKGAPDSLNLVGRNGFTVSRASENNSPIALFSATASAAGRTKRG